MTDGILLVIARAFARNDVLLGAGAALGWQLPVPLPQLCTFCRDLRQAQRARGEGPAGLSHPDPGITWQGKDSAHGSPLGLSALAPSRSLGGGWSLASSLPLEASNPVAMTGDSDHFPH